MIPSFLQAIRDDPDDDAPRLVLAGWLEEHGGRAGAARAEFLRVPCEWARWVPDLRRRSDLQEGEREPHLDAEEWLGPLRRPPRPRMELTLADPMPYTSG
jgi:uncharacterized protein (TIGR02996 family)